MLEIQFLAGRMILMVTNTNTKENTMIYRVIAQIDLDKLEPYLHKYYRNTDLILNDYQTFEAAQRYAQMQRDCIDLTNLKLDTIRVVEIDEPFQFADNELTRIILDLI